MDALHHAVASEHVLVYALLRSQAQKAFGALNLQLSQEAPQGSRQHPRSPVATHQTQLNFQKKGCCAPTGRQVPSPPRLQAVSAYLSPSPACPQPG